MTISSQETPLTAWSLLLSQRQDLLQNHLERVLITPNRQGTMEMQDEVLSSVGAQDMDTSGYQVSDLEDIEFHWEDPDLNMDAIFRPGIVTPFFLSTFNNFEMGSMAENTILIDEEQEKENSPLPTHPTSIVSERPTQPRVFMRSRSFGTRIEKVLDFVHRNLFEKLILRLLCMCFNVNYN